MVTTAAQNRTPRSGGAMRIAGIGLPPRLLSPSAPAAPGILRFEAFY
jgi:hypothetical protein